MPFTSRKFWTTSLSILAVIGLLTGLLIPLTDLSRAQAASSKQGLNQADIQGPFISQTAAPTTYTGDLRDLKGTSPTGGEVPAPGKTTNFNQGENINITPWIDPVAQTSFGLGQMPEPIVHFDGLNIIDGGGWHPPDTNGDVGPNHYIQTVNIAIGIYDKTDGTELVNLPYNAFFSPAPSPCNNQNRGDVIVLYDPQVDRWIVTDFSLPSGGPFYECIAVSMSGDPVGGGWHYYAVRTNDGVFLDYWHDYPKLGVWADGWYMSANMFHKTTGAWGGVRVWAFDREDALIGAPMDIIDFDCTDVCGSLLPANLRGTLPPAGSPQYFAGLSIPDSLFLFEFHTDWDTPTNSSFTWTAVIPVAEFQLTWDIPQKDVAQVLDSLADRLMFSLQYRNLADGTEALYVNHSVTSGDSVGVRWYEVHDPGGSPLLYQQGTYQPDDNFRWMGSIAADQDGNIAVGYSVSSSILYPSIRYAGQLAGETPGILTQNEASLMEGTGSQTGSNRWGDYSSMTVDPDDDCTFWYTQEYLKTTSGNWETHIGSFKFPSCGQPKGTIEGFVYNSVTGEAVAGVPVFSQGTEYTFSTLTDDTGFYSMPLMAGSYDVTAGPLLPGYPAPQTETGLVVSPPDSTTFNFALDPVPALVDDGSLLNDSVAGGNGNGYAEPGEQGLLLSEYLLNQGAITSTLITAVVTSFTEGVTVESAETTYPDIAVGAGGVNDTPYIFSVDPLIACGTDLNFRAVITDSMTTHITDFSINASVPLTRTDFYNNDIEGGAGDWTTGGTRNTWAITSNQSHSPTHSWADSPAGNYQNDTNSWVRTGSMDLTGQRQVQLTGWFKYALELDYDYVYVEYSLDGGTTWNPDPLVTFNGEQPTWQEVTVDASVLDEQPEVALRFRLQSDGGVVEDGIFIDDISLSSIPWECTYSPVPDAPTLISPVDASWIHSPVTFVWQPADSGVPAEGYVFYLDDSNVITTTQTTLTLDISPWAHSWYVVATNASGYSLPSATWSFDVFGKIFLPVTQK